MGRHSTHRRRGAALAASTAVVGVAAGVLAPTASAAPDSDWDRLAQCESGGNWATNTGNGYYGGLQFSASTWDAYGGQEFGFTADKASREEQIVIGERVLAGQGWGAWPACSAKLGLTSAAEEREAPSTSAQESSVSTSSAPDSLASLPGLGALDGISLPKLEISALPASATQATDALYQRIVSGFEAQGLPVPDAVSSAYELYGASFDEFYSAVSPYLNQALGIVSL